MCIYCDDIYKNRIEINSLTANDDSSPMAGGALFCSVDAKNPEDSYLYSEFAEHFSWADLTPAEEIGVSDESVLGITFDVTDEECDATIVTIGFLVYFCPWCGRDLRPRPNEEVTNI